MRPRHNILQPFLTLLLLLVASVASAQREIPAEESDFKVQLLGDNRPEMKRPGPIKVVGLDDKPELKDYIENVAFEARSRIRDTTKVDWLGTAYIVWVDDEDEYRKFTNHSWEFTAAAANASKATVWINARAWNQNTPGENLKTMTHELGHLLVGDLTGPNRLPLWAEEGIVMHLAGEWSFDRTMQVSQARMMGQLPHLSEIENSFPRDPTRQRLAYAMSYTAIRVIGERYGDEPQTATRLMRRLADVESGPRLVRDLWDPSIRDGWQGIIEKDLGNRVFNLFIFATSGTAIWIIATVLLFMAYKRKRRINRARYASDPDEGAWTESLTQRDIEDIYGEREDKWSDSVDYEESPGPDEDDLHPWEKWERMQEEKDRY